MRFSTQTLLALLASPFLAIAVSTANPFTTSITATAGETTTLNWTPTTSGTVSLILRSGASSDLNAGTYIARDIDNSGSYEWSVPSSVTRGSDYTVEIVDDSDSDNYNFSPYFVIESTNTVASTTSDISSGVPSSSISLSSASNTLSSTSSGSVTSASSSTGSASSTGSSSSGMTTSTGSASRSGSSSTSGTSSASRTSSASASASASSSATALTGMAAANVIPLGLLALGALAL